MSTRVPIALVSSRDHSLARASEWFRVVGAGERAPSFEVACELEVDAIGRFAALGGLDVYPHNSQALVEQVAERLASPVQALVVVVPSGSLRPHCWHLPHPHRRGVRVQRYAILPADATLGAVAHELGHLLFDWPDLATDSGLGSECLMARGALLPEPAPPCAVLRLRAGWMPPLAPERAMRVADLELGEAVKIGERVIERRRNPDRLLVLLDRARPILLRRIELRREDLERPLLAVARFQ